MIKVLIYVRDRHLYIDEFHRRFRDKFQYRVTMNGIDWEHMRITVVTGEPRGYLADIAINFNQDGVNIFTRRSRINIKEKRTTTYFDLLDAINNDGTFNWGEYLKEEEDDEDDWWV